MFLRLLRGGTDKELSVTKGERRTFAPENAKTLIGGPK
jgi:hypothetical protein